MIKSLLIGMLLMGLTLTCKAQKKVLDSVEALLLGTWRFDEIPTIEIQFEYNGRDTVNIREIDTKNPDWYIQYKIIFRWDMKAIAGGTGYKLTAIESSDKKQGENRYYVRAVSKNRLMLFMTDGIPLLKSNSYWLTRVNAKPLKE